MFFQKPIVERLKPHFNFKIAILFGASYFMLGNHNVFFNSQLSLQLGWGPTCWEKRQGERAWILCIFLTWTQWRSCSFGWVSRDTVISMKPWWPCWMDSSHSASFRVSGSKRNSWVDCFLFGLWPFNHQFINFSNPAFESRQIWHGTIWNPFVFGVFDPYFFLNHSLISQVFFGSHDFISQLLMVEPFNGLV